MKGKNNAQYSVYQTQDGSWMWMMEKKWATIPNFPSKGKKPTQEEAGQMAIAYLREAERVRINPRYKPSLEQQPVPVINQPAATSQPSAPAQAIPQAPQPPAAQPLPATPATPVASDAEISLLDTSYLIHRSYHGIQAALKAEDGTPTNAVYGFCKAVLKLIKDKSPKLLLAVMDPGGKTWRHDIYPDYKKDRQEKPDLEVQKPICEEFLKVIGVKMAKVPRYEADDILGTLAKKFSKDRKVVIETSDKDIMQLVTDKVTLSHPYEDKVVGVKEVFTKFGTTPDKVMDILALTGDTSDSIPGIPGIGEKTAATLIAKYGSVEELLEKSGELKGKMGENVRANKDLALICKRLTTIDTDAPCSVLAEDCTYNVNTPDVIAFFRKYGLKSLIEELSHLSAATPAAPQKIDKIEEFRRDYFFLSNFYKLPSPIIYNGKPFPTTEHLFQSFKTTDAEWKEKVRTAPTPGDAKKLGREVPMRPDWEPRKIEAMKLCLDLKFAQEPLQKKLVETGDAILVEGNTWKDTFWGVCNGKGENVLGRLLMEKRESLLLPPPWE